MLKVNLASILFNRLLLSRSWQLLTALFGLYKGEHR